MEREKLIKSLMEKYAISKENAEKMADDILSMHEETVSGLVKNNKEIKAEKKELQEKMSKFKDVDPEKYSEMQKQLKKIEEEELLGKQKYEEVLAIKSKEFETEKTKLAEDREKLQKELDDLIIERDLTNGLITAGVKKDVMEVVKKAMLADTKITEVDGKRVAIINDTPVTKHLEEWKKSEIAQNFIAAPNNAGAGGGNGSSNPNESETAVDPVKYYEEILSNGGK